MTSGIAPGPDLWNFKDLQFEYGQVLCKGGLNTKVLPMVTRKVGFGSTAILFVKMGVAENWLRKSVSGATSVYGSGISRTNLRKKAP